MKLLEACNFLKMKRSDLNNGSKGKLNCRAQEKTGKHQQPQKLEHKLSVKTEETKCKPFFGKVFYLDLPPNVLSENLEKDIKAFGGTVEGFLSKDISYLISNKKEAKFAHTVRRFSPEGSPEPLQNAGNGSLCPNNKKSSLDGSQQNTSARISRGKSLVEKVIKEQEIIPANSVLANALSWGVKVIHVDDIKSYIEQKKGCANIKKPAPVVKDVGKGSNIQKVKSGRLKKPFVKVEDGSRHYRPFYQQLSSFPVVNYSVEKTYSPFDVEKKICAVQKQAQSTLRNKTNTERESETQALPNFKDRKKKGYCECCMKKYEDLQSHVETEQHRMFAEGDQYQVVDDVISKFPYDFVEYRNDKIKRMKCSTTMNNPIENVLKKDQLEERLNMVNVLLQQETCDNIPAPTIQAFEPDHPNKTLNSSVQKPAPISGSSPLKFHHTFHSEVMNKPETSKTENHDSANGIIATTNCLKEINLNRDSEGYMETLPNVCNNYNLTNKSKLLLDKNHLKEDTDMPGYNSVTPAQVKDFSEGQKRIPKPNGRLSLKKRKVDGSLITPAKCCKLQEFSDCTVEKNVDGENLSATEMGKQPCGHPAKNASFLLASEDVRNLPIESGVCKPNNPELENLHLKDSFVNHAPLDDPSLIFLENNFKRSSFDPVDPQIPNTFVLGTESKDHFIIHKETQILQSESLIEASSIFPAKDSHVSGFGLRSNKTKTNIVGLQNLPLKKQCTNLQISPVNDSQFIFQANDFKSDFLSVALKCPNSFELKNCQIQENNTIAELGHDLQDTLVNIASCSTTVDVSTNFELENQQMSGHCTVHEVGQDTLNRTMNGISFILQANDFQTVDIDPAVSKNFNNFELENHQMNEDCRHNQVGQELPQSCVNDPSFLEAANDLKTSACDPVFDSFSSNSELENHQTNVNCTVHEILQDLQKPSLNDGSFYSPATNIAKRDDPVINIFNGSRLEKNCIEDNCSFQRMGPHLQTSLLRDASFIIPEKNVNISDIDFVGDKIPNNVGIQNYKKRENGRVHENEQDLQKSDKGNLCINPEKDLQNLYLMVDKSYNCFILEKQDLKMCNSPVKDISFNFPVSHFQAPGIDLVIGRSAKHSFLENHDMKYDCPIHTETDILQNSIANDISFSSPAKDLKMSCLENVASKISNSFTLENHKSKDNLTIYKIKQVAPNSPLKNTSLVLPQHISKTSDLHPSVNKILTSFELETHHLKGNCTIHELGQLLHISPVSDGVFIFRTKGLKALVSESRGAIAHCFLLNNYPLGEGCTNQESGLLPHNSTVKEHMFGVCTDNLSPGKMIRKVKLSSGRSKRKYHNHNVEFCCQLANEMSAQQNDCCASSFSMEHWLQLFQTSEAGSDFMGFAVFSEKGESFPNECREEQCSSTSMECLLELFQKSESQSTFLGFSVYSEQERTPYSDDYWDEQTNSTPIDLLDLFQTSEAHSDFLGFTFSEIEKTSCSSGECEEQSAIMSIESFSESSNFQTSDRHSNSLGLTNYSAKEDTNYLTNVCAEQSTNTPPESLLKVFQTSETRSEFFGFASYSGQESPGCPNIPMKDQSLINPCSLFG
ncbi:protein DBF4 homolog A isoform X2 [Pleurodeles waltl]|uniref:protein DBF4 homolog A isoform X2 n=1 Tax=Pleurodeles waltl TaxID=8319 RepID=UPI0037098B51